jgi:hypothetical protein
MFFIKRQSGDIKLYYVGPKSDSGPRESDRPEEAFKFQTLAEAMLRYDVNKRKHAVYDSLARDRKSAGGGCDVAPSYWSDAPQALAYFSSPLEKQKKAQ